MKKMGLMLSLLALGACSSYKKNYDYITTYPGMDEETMKEWSQPYESTAIVRSPSSEVVGRPKYYWEADSLKVPLTAKATINQTYNVKFNQFSVYDVKEKVERTVSQVEVQWERVQNSVLVCDEQSGTGKSELWNAFYQAPAATKWKALAAAIDGVGEVSAKALLKKNYFHSKPRNWREFQDEIQRAAQAEVITKSVEHQILYRYRSENMTKLGYNTQLSGVCRLEIETYYSPREVVVTKKILVDEIVTHRDLISSEIRPYEVKISGQRLQSFENEMLVFSFNRETNQVTLAPATYNNYSVSFDGSKITVLGISRKSVKLPSDVLSPGATLESSAGKARFTAPLNRLYVPKTATDGHLLISIRVYSCKKGLLGGCAVFSRDEKIQPVVVKQALPETSLVNHTFVITPGRKYWVEYWANTANSPWYSSNIVKASSKPEL